MVEEGGIIVIHRKQISESKDTWGGIDMVPDSKILLMRDVEKAKTQIRNLPASFATSQLLQIGVGEAGIF